MTQSTKIISKIKMFRKIGNLKQEKILDQPTIVNKKNLGNKSVMCTSNYIIFKDKKIIKFLIENVITQAVK